MRVEDGAAGVTHVPVTLEDAPLPPAPAVASAPGPSSGATTPVEPAPEPARRGPPIKTWIGYGAGVAGVVLLGVGAYELATAMGRSNDESKYPSGSWQRQTVAASTSQAMTYAVVTGVTGVAALGAGIFLVLTSPGASAPPTSASRSPLVPVPVPVVGPHEGGLAWSAAF